jgi:hypothetical protein
VHAEPAAEGPCLDLLRTALRLRLEGDFRARRLRQGRQLGGRRPRHILEAAVHERLKARRRQAEAVLKRGLLGGRQLAEQATTGARAVGEGVGGVRSA